jgi:hypothetical protein
MTPWVDATRLHPLIGLVALLAIGASAGHSQTASAQPLNWSADDSSRIAWLEMHGRSLRGRYVTVWAPNDSLSKLAQRALVDTLDVGVGALRSLMKAPLAWQRMQNRPIVFYFSPGRFVAHASGRDAVFIPISRVQSRQAPFLHEASHELLAPEPPFFWWEHADSIVASRVRDETPLWLFEGVPDILAQTVAAQHALHEGDVFSIGGLGKVDSTCAARVRASPRGGEVLAAIGRRGRLEALFTTERAAVAPVFYACGQSMTKFLVEQMGLARVIELFPAMKAGTWEARIAEATGKPLAMLRSEWVNQIGLSDHQQ